MCRWLRIAILAAGLAVWAMPARGQEVVRAGNDAPRGSGIGEIEQCVRPPGLDEHEAENRAADHYDRGIHLYEQGDYEAAIEEFVSAYCHKPYYRVLKDIAQSFERMVSYEKAVAYLQAYLRAIPAGEVEERRVQAARVEVLRRLPARVRVATMPPGATVTLRDARGLQARARADDEKPIAIRKGRYVMTVEQDGYEPLSRTIDLEIGQPYSYYFQLEPRKGALRLVAVPANARIFIDKRWVAVGSYVADLPLGSYQVELEAEGFERAVRTVEITETEARTVSIELEPLPESGRVELISASALGGAFWGTTISFSIFKDEPLLSATGGALGLGVGLGSAYLGVPDDIEVGRSSYIIGSTLIGMLEGALLTNFIAQRLSLCEERQGNSESGTEALTACEGRIVTGAGLSGSVAGALFATLTASRFDLDAGDAAIINSGALWGSVAGGLLWSVFGQDSDVGALLGLTGLNLGLLASALVAERVDYSRSHVALIDLGGLGGLLLGGMTSLALANTVGSQDERTPHFALVGMGAGLVLSGYLTRDMDDPARALPGLGPTLGRAVDASGRDTTIIGLGGGF